LQARLDRHWRQDLASLHAYVVQDSRGLIKLDVMENPYGLPDALQEALGQRLGRVALNRYPAEGTERLKAALSRQAGLPEGCGMVLGNGSDELITLLSMVCDRPGATVMAPLPGFVMYQLSAFYQGLRFEGVPLTADFQLDVPAMLALLACGGTHRQTHSARAWLRRHSPLLLLCSAVSGLLMQLHSLNLQQWSFNWSTALVLIASLWALWYLLRSRQLRDYALDQPH
jgi:hypothetical protein